jgi:acetyl esterase/lipase
MAIRFDQSAPYEVEERDVPYLMRDGAELLARIYRPKGEGAGLPAIVDIHGGAWNRNDRTSGALHCRALAACGIVVASLDFRQGPAHRHPAANEDIAAGVRWVRSEARALGIDRRQVGICGSSSGGQLALMHALTATGDAAVAYVLALYPVTDPLARYHYVLSREDEPMPESGFDAKRLIASHRAYFADEAAMAEASVTLLVESGQARARPPVFVAQPERDDNVPASITEGFVRAYRGVGGRIEHAHVPRERHGFTTKPSPETDKCIALMRDFVGRQLRSG